MISWQDERKLQFRCLKPWDDRSKETSAPKNHRASDADVLVSSVPKKSNNALVLQVSPGKNETAAKEELSYQTDSRHVLETIGRLYFAVSRFRLVH